MFKKARGRLNVKMPSYQYTDPHVKDKTVSRKSHLQTGKPIPGKTVFILRPSPGLFVVAVYHNSHHKALFNENEMTSQLDFLIFK